MDGWMEKSRKREGGKRKWVSGGEYGLGDERGVRG